MHLKVESEQEVTLEEVSNGKHVKKWFMTSYPERMSEI